VSLDEKAFFNERPEQRPAKYPCPRCKRTNEYSVRYVRRTKKDRPPQGGDANDRAKFDKLRDHLLRLDDDVVCKTCGKKFEIPSLHSMLFLDQIEGLPKDVEDEEPGDGNREPGVDARKPMDASARAALPARFTRPSKGWRG
jgi:DNA-directed RNA polymerase subunit RPC12/RpoP